MWYGPKYGILGPCTGNLNPYPAAWNNCTFTRHHLSAELLQHAYPFSAENLGLCIPYMHVTLHLLSLPSLTKVLMLPACTIVAVLKIDSIFFKQLFTFQLGTLDFDLLLSWSCLYGFNTCIITEAITTTNSVLNLYILLQTVVT